MKLQGNGMCEKSHKGIKEAMKFKDRWPKAQRRKVTVQRGKCLPTRGLQIQLAGQHKYSAIQDQREQAGIQTQQWCQHESTSCQSLRSLV